MAVQHHHLASGCCQLQPLTALNAEQRGDGTDANVAVAAVDDARQPAATDATQHSDRTVHHSPMNTSGRADRSPPTDWQK